VLAVRPLKPADDVAARVDPPWRFADRLVASAHLSLDDIAGAFV
jgi:hypothetical protein